MKKTLKIVTLPGLFLTDILFSLAAVIVGIAMRFDGQFAPQYVEIIPLFWAMTAVGLVGFGMLFGCYFNVWENASVNELVRQVMAVLATHVAIYVLNGTFDLGMPRGVIMAAFMVLLFATLSVRLSARLVLWFVAYFRRNRSNPDAKRVLIVGAGDAGVFLAKRLFSQKDGNRQPVGFLDDNASLWNRWINGLPVFGGRRELADVVRRNGVKEVILAMKDADPELLKSLFASCQKLKVKVSRFDTLSQLDGESQNGARIREVSVEELLGREPVELDMEPVKALIQGATVLVTGGAGSIGSEICRQVLQWGCGHLVVFDFHENGLFDIGNELAAKYPATQYNLVLGSIRDECRLEEVFAKYKPSFVFHAAAHKHVPMMEWNPLEAVKNNIIGTWNVARKADAHGVRKMILISTDKAVNPTNIMGATKRCAELVMQMMDRQSDTEFAAVRFGNVLGSNGSVVPHFKKQIAEGGPVTVTHKDITRYFMTIPEACQLVLQAGAMARGGELFVLDMGTPVRIYDLAVALIQLSGLEPETDIPIVFTGLRPGEKMFEELRISGEDMSRTASNKIFVMAQEEGNVLRTVKHLEHLQKALGAESPEEVFTTVHEMVPTFEHGKNDKVNEIVNQ
jgi:FlaA1/EpsC-like NDP-sugar epimerase